MKGEKMNLSTIWKYCGFGIAILAGSIGIGFKYFGPNVFVDEAVEKVCEKVIDKETGIDINFDSGTVTTTSTTTTTPVKNS
jgi:hypothetical protein